MKIAFRCDFYSSASYNQRHLIIARIRYAARDKALKLGPPSHLLWTKLDRFEKYLFSVKRWFEKYVKPHNCNFCWEKHSSCTIYLIAVLMKTDMVAMPSPDPETRNISTNSLFLLKYWPTIRVAGSRVIATPTPNLPKKKKK